MCFFAMLGRIWSAGQVSWLHRTTMKHKITVVQSHVGLGAEMYRLFRYETAQDVRIERFRRGELKRTRTAMSLIMRDTLIAKAHSAL